MDRSPLLIKACRDRDQMASEISKLASARRFPNRFFVLYQHDSPNEVAESNGWYAVAARFEASAQTLLEWVLDERGSGVEAVLARLCLGGGLKDAYESRELNETLRPNEAICDSLPPARQARILAAVEKLSPLAEKYCNSCGFDARLIRTFLKSRRFDDVDENLAAKGTHRCLSHGDLHGRNVLVDQRDMPVLVDPGSIEMLHWAMDLSRLIVDLLLSAWDDGPASFEWSAMEDWHAIAERVIVGDLPTNPTTSKNQRVLRALRWLRGKVWSVHPQLDAETTKWELQLAMSVELLRSSYRTDLTAPKRVLGLAAGCTGLRRAAESFDQVRSH